MPDTRSDSLTRQKLLDAAQNLMLDKGYAATSVGEICQVAGLTKGSFFHYFASKEELGKAVLYHYLHPMQIMMQEAPFNTIEDPLERLFKYCDFIVELLENPLTPKSCLFGNLAQELFITHPEICAVSREGFSWWADWLETEVAAAKDRYKPHFQFDTKSMARHFITIYEGALILAKAHQNPGLINEQVEHFKRYLEMLFAPDEKKL